MNKIILIGNLTKKPEIETTNNGTNFARLTVACRRRIANDKGEYDSDFISCIAWKSNADFICKYFDKGDKIALTGTLQVRQYEDNGVKKYISEVIVSEVEFVQPPKNKSDSPKDDGLKPIEDETLPF